MASALMTSSMNTPLHHHSKTPLGKPKVAPNPKASHVPKSSSLDQAENLTIKSNNNNPFPEIQIDEYMTLKAKKINKALFEGAAVPLILQYPTLPNHEGERVHGTLCIASCELVGGNESSVMPLACAAEMLVTLALNRALLCYAVEHMATKTKNVSPDRLVRAIGEISSAVGTRGVLAGRIMEINSKGKDVSLSELDFIQRLRCGKLIEASVVCGVLIGGGSEEDIEKLRKYGKCVGLAYQVWDDILDNMKKKKEAGDDKATYPKLMGVAGAKRYAKELVAEANQELAYFDSTRAAPLYHLADFLVSRHK